jgi:probable HAF family extracellular repeat protein
MIGNRPVVLISTATVSALVGAPRAAAPTWNPTPPPQYRIVEIKVPFGYYVNPRALNDRGEVVGYCVSQNGNIVGFRWKDGKARKIATLPGMRETFPSSINNQGVIVGDARQKEADPAKGFIVRADKTEPLSAILKRPFAHNLKCDNDGTICGSLIIETDETVDHPFHGRMKLGHDSAFVLRGNRVRELPSAGGQGSIARDLHQDAVVGHAQQPGRQWQACAWIGGRVRFLEELGGGRSQATAINRHGVVVGDSELADGSTAACKWEKGHVRSLGKLGTLKNSLADDINDRSEVIGIAYTDVSAPVPFLHREGRMRELGKLLSAKSGWILSTANDISERGWIVGMGEYKGSIAGYLLIPTGR